MATTTIPERFYSLKPNLIFCVAVPLYLILFMVTYCPTFGFDDWFTLWEPQVGIIIPIIAAIELGCILISRTVLCFALVRHSLSRIEYLTWMMVELVVINLFVALFISLYMQMKYFDTLPRILLVGFGINIFPYAFYWIAEDLICRDNRLSETEKLLEEMRRGIERNESGAIRFIDEKGNTKLVVGSERVISLESAGNYVTILYDNDGKLVRYSLRNSLKGIEDVCKANNLVRCHRSFFVNLNKIKIIRRTPQGVFAEIDHAGVEDIPVSKTYAPELLRLFSE